MVTVRRFLSALDAELDGAVLQREEGVVLPQPTFSPGGIGAALANDDVAGENELTAVAL